MKRLFSVLLATPFLLCAHDHEEKKEEKEPAINLVEISEAFGHHIARNLVNPEMFALDVESVIAGIRKHAAGQDSPLSEEEYGQAINALKEKAYDHLVKNNLLKANAFLRLHRALSGVVELESGKLQYIVDHKGQGEEVLPHSTPLIHYEGKYLDGKVFGSSLEGEPIALNLDEAIQGFALGIVGMKEGEKRTLYIHPDLAYGTGGYLSPNALLIFEIEVLKADCPENIDENGIDIDQGEHHKLTMD